MGVATRSPPSRMDLRIATVLAALESRLPIALEEGDAPGAVALAEVEHALAADADAAYAAGALAVVDRLFCTLGLLSKEARAEGVWRFMSFPAWLVARSVLQSLSTTGQSLVSPGYWGTQPAQRDLEEQRALLRQLEERRARYHPTQAAPIRFVHVAWAAIQVGERLLLLHREDRSRPDARGNYVLPGGRFRLADAPVGARPAHSTRELAYGGSGWPAQFLDRTLARELHEELDFVADDDYTATWQADLPLYRRVEGARNHLAYTEYSIAVFAVRLTQRGYLKLLTMQAWRPGAQAWFTLAELDAGRTSAGATAFIDALRPALVGGAPLLVACGASFVPEYRLPGKQKGLDLPLAGGRRLRYGKTGEGVLDLDVPLSDAEAGWLLALGWHAKSLPFAQPAQRPLLDDGWVALQADDVPLLARLRDRLDAAGLPALELVDDAFARLSMPPSAIFFDTALFRCSVLPGALCLRLGAATTPIGTVGPLERTLPVGPSIAATLKHVAGISPLSPKVLVPDSLRRMVNQELAGPARDLGVRQILDGLTYERHHWRLTIGLDDA